MKKTNIIFLPLLLAVSAWAQPNYFNYQGVLKDDQGEPLDTGAYQMEFNIYDVALDGDPIWGPFLFDDGTDEGHTKMVQVANGRFNVILGPTDTTGRSLSEVFSGGDTAYVQLRVGTGDPILPRQQILSTPYAFKAATAVTANSAATATTAGSASSASELTGLEWNAPGETRAIVTIGGEEKLGIGNPGKGGNGTLDVSAGHVFVDEDFGIFSTDETGNLEAGFDSDLDGNLHSDSQGTRKVDLTSDRLVPTVNATSITGGAPGLYLGSSSRRWKAVYSVTGSIQTSDRRLKTHIEDLEYGLDEVLKMRPTRYHWKSDPTGANNIGLIGQELQEIIPEAVDIGNDEDQTLGVKYSDVIPVLINATKEQQEYIESLRKEIQSLEDRLQALEAKLGEL